MKKSQVTIRFDLIGEEHHESASAWRAEAARILYEISQKVRLYGDVPDGINLTIRDRNGNTIGNAAILPPAERAS